MTPQLLGSHRSDKAILAMPYSDDELTLQDLPNEEVYFQEEEAGTPEYYFDDELMYKELVPIVYGSRHTDNLTT